MLWDIVARYISLMNFKSIIRASHVTQKGIKGLNLILLKGHLMLHGFTLLDMPLLGAGSCLDCMLHGVTNISMPVPQHSKTTFLRFGDLPSQLLFTHWCYILSHEQKPKTNLEVTYFNFLDLMG